MFVTKFVLKKKRSLKCLKSRKMIQKLEKFENVAKPKNFDIINVAKMSIKSKNVAVTLCFISIKLTNITKKR